MAADMTKSDRIEALHALLSRTEDAHGAYETTELNGVYDDNWPSWYAQYAVDHGISDLLGGAVSADEMAVFLAGCWREYQQAESARREPWAAYTARRIADELVPESGQGE